VNNFRYILLVFFFLHVIQLQARENPFLPAKGISQPNYTTNTPEKIPPFTHTSIEFSPSARVLQSITVTSKNLDGTITNKTININKTIDWHKHLELSQENTKDIKLTNKTKQPEKKVEKKELFKKVASLKFITFYTSKQTIKLTTNDKLLRNFKLIKPDRIILDFKRDTNFSTKTFKGSEIFKKITLGNHKNYYRVVLELDGHYIYSISNKKNNIFVELH